jgi:sugar phosphate isomerase/epimerase
VPLPVLGPGPLGRWLREDLPHFQAQTGVKVAVENMPYRRLGPFNLDAFHFTQPEALDHFQYLTFDTTHAGTRNLNLLNFYHRFKPKITHIHLSNYNGQEHQLLNNGHLPLKLLLETLVTNGFAGLVSIELNPSSLQAEHETRLKRNLKDSLSFCQEALAF